MQNIDTSKVVALLKKNHLKKQDLAAPLRTTPQNVSFKLNGKVKIDIYDLKILCELFEIDTGEVFDYFVITDD